MKKPTPSPPEMPKKRRGGKLTNLKRATLSPSLLLAHFAPDFELEAAYEAAADGWASGLLRRAPAAPLPPTTTKKLSLAFPSRRLFSLIVRPFVCRLHARASEKQRKVLKVLPPLSLLSLKILKAVVKTHRHTGENGLSGAGRVRSGLAPLGRK